MKRFVLRFFFWLSVLLLVLAAFLWLVSHEVATGVFWTPNTTRYEVSSAHGRFVFGSHDGWLWKEAVTLQRTPAEDASSDGIEHWLGFTPHAHHEFLGVEIASGEFVSSFRNAPPDYDGPPNTMLRTTTDFFFVIVPYWLILCLTALIPASSVLRRIAGRRAHVCHEHAALRR